MEGLWVGDKTLKEAFPRLYNLSTRKDGLVKDMGEWCEGRWTWKVEWRRRLLDRERALESDLFNLLAAVSLTEGTRDRWEWGNGKGRVFSVKEAYLAITKSFISSTVGRPPAACLNHIWKGYATTKARITAWRLLRNRLATKDNVSKRIALDAVHQTCSGCGLTRETADHVFLECPQTVRIWSSIIEWVGMNWAAPNNISSHLLSFAGMLRGKAWKRRLGGLWMCTIWVLWRWRNDGLFCGKQWITSKVLDEIKGRFWSWCVARGDSEEVMTFHTWSNTKLVERWIF